LERKPRAPEKTFIIHHHLSPPLLSLLDQVVALYEEISKSFGELVNGAAGGGGAGGGAPVSGSGGAAAAVVGREAPSSSPSAAGGQARAAE
jgi:hypothetical protein